jgi:hypothetical protein
MCGGTDRQTDKHTDTQTDTSIPSLLEETLLYFSMYRNPISLPYVVGSPLGPLLILSYNEDRGLGSK